MGSYNDSLVWFINSVLKEGPGNIKRLSKFQMVADFLKAKRTTLLGLGCYTGHVKLVKTLLEQGVDVNEDARNGSPALFILCQNYIQSNIILTLAELLIYYKAEVNRQNSRGQTALHLACHHNQEALVDLLIRKGSDVNICNINGDTPLSEICKAASKYLSAQLRGIVSVYSIQQSNSKFPMIDICMSLLRAGADPKKGTILPYVIVNCPNLLQQLVDLGMDVNLKDKYGRSPLDYTFKTRGNAYTVLKLLVENGANFNEARKKLKFDLIVEAYMHGDIDIICYFLSYGASLSSEQMAMVLYPRLPIWVDENREVNDLDHKFLIWNLLVKAGFRPTLSAVVSMVDSVSNLHKCNYSSTAISEFLMPLMTLSDLCRVVVRSHLRLPIDDSVDQLPLPNGLKGFLKFNEIKSQGSDIKHRVAWLHKESHSTAFDDLLARRPGRHVFESPQRACFFIGYPVDQA